MTAARPRLHQRPVHREVLVRQKPRSARLRDLLCNERPRALPFQQPLNFELTAKIRIFA